MICPAEATPDMHTVARHVLDAFGGEPRVARCHAGEEHWVDVLRCDDRPEPGLTSWATVGMHRFPTGYTAADDRPIRVELVGLTHRPGDGAGCGEFDSVLASCAFNLVDGEYAIAPDLVFPDLVRRYVPDLSTAHVMFVPVLSWDGLDDVEVDGCHVSWLQAVPITPAEFDHARTHGVDALQTLLEEADADVADLDRPSVA